MKLFQQLLVAPAALGLLATGANAAELNINGVSDYAASADQVTSVTQFSDVYPTDWAYQALAGLVETYGCVAGYPNGTFRGNRAMTRYEAAALLNACLDRVTEVTDELRRLMAEFETELAILKGRVDGLEARVGELEATQFSTTTKLKGKATFVTGAMDSEDAGAQADDDAFSFSYDYRLGLKTSFTGKDLLFARLRAGNMKDGSAFLGRLPQAGHRRHVRQHRQARPPVLQVPGWFRPDGHRWSYGPQHRKPGHEAHGLHGEDPEHVRWSVWCWQRLQQGDRWSRWCDLEAESCQG